MLHSQRCFRDEGYASSKLACLVYWKETFGCFGIKKKTVMAYIRLFSWFHNLWWTYTMFFLQNSVVMIDAALFVGLIIYILYCACCISSYTDREISTHIFLFSIDFNFLFLYFRVLLILFFKREFSTCIHFVGRQVITASSMHPS